MKKILCIGLGKLGLTFSQTLATYYPVYGYDVNKKLYYQIKNNSKQIEPNLNNLIKKNKKNFFLVNNLGHAIDCTNCTFLILPTPSKKNHDFDNQYILKTLSQIGFHLKNKSKYHIVITSTVNPGSCNYFIQFLC